MRATTQIFGSIQDWISDFWLCKTADVSIGGVLVPRWDPPHELDQWPALPSGLQERYAPDNARRIDHARFLQLLDSALILSPELREKCRRSRSTS